MAQAQEILAQRYRARTHYEMSNHLGNVLTTVTDRKTRDAVQPGYVYEAEVSSVSDYDPFGMQLEGREMGEEYRFGFNGKENDNEVKGEGNQQDYGFRIYDTRLARFLSVDPLTKDYAMLTPYQFASNMPIAAVDVDGLEAKIIVHELGANSTMTYTVDLKDPNLNPKNVLYADQTKYGTRGVLTVIKKTNSDDIVKIFEIGALDWAANKWDQLTDDNYPGGVQGSGINITSRYGGGPMETRDFPLDGATSIEMSDLLTYTNLTKFANLPTNTIRSLLKEPEQIADLADLITDGLGEYQELDLEKNVEGYFYKNSQNGTSPEFVPYGPSTGNTIETRISLKGDSITHIKRDKKGNSIDTTSAVARKERPWKRTELIEFKGVVKKNR